ncbi:retrovirus-related pol polyprotein from transposon TNT 1-94 [Tanacetum coccineum]
MTEPSWIDALQEEIHEFERLQVWELVSCPDKVMLIKLKWIYKVKMDEFSRILKNKARLVAQGFRKEEGIDFKESFSPVARIENDPALMTCPGYPCSDVTHFGGVTDTKYSSKSGNGLLILQSLGYVV